VINTEKTLSYIKNKMHKSTLFLASILLLASFAYSRFLQTEGTVCSSQCSSQCASFKTAYNTFANRPNVQEIIQDYQNANYWATISSGYLSIFTRANNAVKDLYSYVQLFSGKPLVGQIADALWTPLQNLYFKEDQYLQSLSYRMNTFQIDKLGAVLQPFANELYSTNNFLYMLSDTAVISKVASQCSNLDFCSILANNTNSLNSAIILDTQVNVSIPDNLYTWGVNYVNMELNPLNDVTYNFIQNVYNILTAEYNATVDGEEVNYSGLDLLLLGNDTAAEPFEGNISEMTSLIQDLIDNNLSDATATIGNLSDYSDISVPGTEFLLPNEESWPSLNIADYDNIKKCYSSVYSN